MLKVKVAITNYGSTQLEFLSQVVEGFRNNKRHQFDITVYTTVPVEYPYVLHPESVGRGLPFTNRRDMIRSLPDYDLFIYNENDHLITEDNIEAFIEHSRTLPDGKVSGFIQYEVNMAGKKVLVGLNSHVMNGQALVENGTPTTFEGRNRHQGCWILLQKDFDRAIKSGGFVEFPHVGPYGDLEQGASDPYTQCGLTKVFPTDFALCERLLIHHLPDKYVKMPQWGEQGIDLGTLFRDHLGVDVRHVDRSSLGK